jgi:hypothetical protein
MKGKKKASSAEQAKSEGVGPNWKYAPPSGAVLVNCKDEDAKEFDWDAINNDDDVELWLIRIPDSVCKLLSTDLHGNTSNIIAGETQASGKYVH